MQQKHSNTAHRQMEAEAMQAKHSNPDYRKQESDAKCQNGSRSHAS